MCHGAKETLDKLGHSPCFGDEIQHVLCKTLTFFLSFALLVLLFLRGHGEQPRKAAASDELVIVCLNSPVKVVSTCWPFSKKGQETELKQMRPFAIYAASLRLLQRGRS